MSVKVEHIFCPIDLKSEGTDSLLLPLSLAGSFQAKILFCFCARENLAEVIDKNHQELQGLIEKAIEFFTDKYSRLSLNWEALVTFADNITGKIICQAASRNSDLIVMRSSRYPPDRPPLIGSVAETVCRTAPCPVLVAPPEKNKIENTPAAINFRRILVAYDFSDYSELALQNAAVLSKKYHSELHLLHVLAEPLLGETELAWTNKTVENLYHQTVRDLQTAVAGQNNLLEKVTTAVRWGKPYREILNYADENDVDLIAMGANGADFGLRTLFGSNADRVLRQASRAVLIASPLKPHCRKNTREISRP